MSIKLRYYLKSQSKLTDKEIDKIIDCFKITSVKANTILLSEGQTCKEFYFIHSGCVRTFYITKQGNEKTRYVAFENSMVSSLASFISKQPSFEFMDTLEDSVLYSIKYSDFFQLVSEIPEWEKFYRTLLETAYLYQNKKIENLVTVSAKIRYDKLMNENPMYVQRLSNRILASYLDIRQETLSRLKSK
ncbi:Crp/Fnr family transcriptional regulator [Flavobacterium sp.]|uniref:Crp/Fnr family transcriptional regulator n=1 Tax=Flavobacterium sp. TaxID=239 RepID=UPI003C3879E4